LESVDDGLRCLLRKIVAGIERAAGHVAGGFAPDRQQIAAVEFSRVAAAPPHDKRRCGDLAAGPMIRLVMLEIDPCGRAIVFAGTVNRLWSKAADVFGNGPII